MFFVAVELFGDAQKANFPRRLQLLKNRHNIFKQIVILGWIDAVQGKQLRQPDALEVDVNRGAGRADAQYKQARALIFLHRPDPDIAHYAVERSYRVIEFGEPGDWDEVFAQYPDVFGNLPGENG